MKTLSIFSKTLLLLLTLTIASCSEDDGDDATPTPTPTTLANEGPIEGTWVTSSEADMGDLAANYSALEFVVTSSDRYTMVWTKKDNTTTTYEGSIVKSESAEKHSNDATIWNIRVIVETINGNPAPGGWHGIYSFDNENRLVLNIEPSVSSWPKHPTAAEGFGSGDSGQGSVHRYNRQ